MKKTFILIVAAVSMFSCGKTSKKASADVELTESGYPFDIKIDFDNKKTPEIKIEEVIPLETTEESVLGAWAILSIAKDHYVIRSEKSIMTYSKDGKFENILNPVGRGPWEVVELVNVIVENDMIIIQNHVTNKILEFDLYGNLVRTNEQVKHFVRERFNGRYLIKKEYEDVPGDKSLTIVSDNGEILNQAIDIVDVKMRLTGGDHFQKLDDHVLFRPTYYSTIYMLDKQDSISVAYNIDLGENWLTQEQAVDPNTDLWGMVIKSSPDEVKYKIPYYEFKENDRFLVLAFSTGGYGHKVFFDKQTQEQYLSKYSYKKKNEYTPEKIVMHNEILAVRDNKFYTLILPYELPAEIREMIPDVDDEDNPVLVIWSII